MTVVHVGWRGLFTNANPHLIEPGYSTEQVNCWAQKPGSLMPRRGNRHLTTTGGSASKDVRSATYHEAPQGKLVVFHAITDGTLYHHTLATNVIAIKTAHDLNRLRPICFARDRQGTLYGVNGVGRGFRWNLASTATTAVHFLGFDAPATQPTVGLTNSVGGATAGDYLCAVRFVDADGNFSNPCTFVEKTAASLDRFDWTSIPLGVSTDGRTTKRQLLRSLSGESDTLYVVTTIADNVTTTYSDTLTDDALAELEAVPVYNADGTADLVRFTPPPRHKPFMCWHRDRMWYYGETIVTEGTAAVTNGSATVTLSGADFVGTNFAGWQFSVAGDFKSYTVTSNSGATLTLSATYGGTTGSGKTYSLFPDPDQRRQLYYSETDEPESVYELNAVTIQENTGSYDKPTGLFSHAGFLWMAHERHLYRASFVQQPAIDLTANLHCERGLINNRCVVVAEDGAYLFDQRGFYRLGESAETISDPIGDIFRGDTLDWSTSEKWHAQYDPRDRVIRWYVMLTGESYTWPRAAYCYSLATQNWALERYNCDMQAGCIAPQSYRTRLLIYSRSDRALMVSEGTADWVTTPLRGNVTSATSTTVSDSEAAFTSEAVGAPISIVQGTGVGQTRIVSAASSTSLTISAAWTTTPDSTSVYLLGAIQWSVKTGLHDFTILKASAQNNVQKMPRSAVLDYEPSTYDAELGLEVYHNHNTAATAWKQTERQPLRGFNFTKDETIAYRPMKRAQYSEANDPGYGSVSFDEAPMENMPVDRCLSIRLSGYQALEQLELHRLRVVGANREDGA